MSDDRIADIVLILERFRERPAMFAGAKTSSVIDAYLSGFDSGCRACGLALPLEMRQQAKEKRGWPRSAEVWSISEMRNRGLTDEEIADEMIAIDIAAWRRMGESNPG